MGGNGQISGKRWPHVTKEACKANARKYLCICLTECNGILVMRYQLLSQVLGSLQVLQVPCEECHAVGHAVLALGQSESW